MMAIVATQHGLSGASALLRGCHPITTTNRELLTMNSNQRSQENNQTDNGGNEKSVSSSRGGTVEKDNLNQSQQSGTLGGSGRQQLPGAQQGSQRSQSIGSQQDANSGQQSTDRTDSQTGSEQQGQAAQRESNDFSGGYPKSPGTSHLAADQNMDDDTGLSNRANRQSVDDIDEGSRQEQQSNVGRRSDMTPD